MSENKPNWAEKATLALSAIQVAQNDQLQRTVSELGALHAEQARLQLNEQQAKEREDRLREGLWVMENGFKELLNKPDLTPSAIYILSMQIQESMASAGFTTAVFRQFADKDRLGTFISGMEQAMQDAKNKMSEEQRANTEAFLLYQSEAQELDALANRLQTESDETDRLLAEANQQKRAALQAVDYWHRMANDPETQKEYVLRKRQRLLAKTGLAIVIWPTVLTWVASCFLVIPISSLANDGLGDGDLKIAWMGSVALVIAIVCTVLCFRFDKKSKPEMSIQEHIDGAEGELKLADTQISLRQVWIDTPWGPEVFAKYKAGDLPELWQRKQERDEFLVQFRQANGLPVEDAFRHSADGLQNRGTGQGDRTMPPPEVKNSTWSSEKKNSTIKLYIERTGGSVPDAIRAVEALMDAENRLKGKK